KQFSGNEFRIRAGVLTIGPLGVGRVLTAGSAVPVHLVVGEAATLERFTQGVAQRFVGREEDMHARVDQRCACPVSVFDHESHPSAPAAKAGRSRSYDSQSNIFLSGRSMGFR